MKNFFKPAFTLAEIMIVLTVIAVLAAVILPVARNMVPDENVVEFKKVDNAIRIALNEILTSEKYFLNGNLTILPDGTCAKNDSLLHAFADVLEHKKIIYATNSHSASKFSTCPVVTGISLIQDMDTIKAGLDNNSDSTYCPACIVQHVYNWDSGAILLQNDAWFVISPPSSSDLGFISVFFNFDFTDNDNYITPVDSLKISNRNNGTVAGGPVLSFSYAIDKQGHIVTSNVVDEWAKKSVND